MKENTKSMINHVPNYDKAKLQYILDIKKKVNRGDMQLEEAKLIKK